MTKATRAMPALGALALGALASLAQPGVSFPLVYLIALPLLYRLWSRTRGRAGAFMIGWFAGLGYFGVSLRWVAEAFLVDAATYGWLIPFALGGLSGGLALFWGTAFALSWHVMRGRSGLGSALVLAAVWGLAELARGHVLTGFPWALFAYGLVDTPLAQGASVLGPYGLTGIIMILGLVAGAALDFRRWRAAAALASVLLLLAVGWYAGMQRLSVPAASDGPVVGAIQPNIPQDEKWRPDMREANLRKVLEPSTALSRVGAKAAVWPEATLPYLLEEDAGLRQYLVRTHGETRIVAGTQRRTGDDWYNSALVLGEDGAVDALYDKRHLVPFGEYLPLKTFLSRLGITKLVSTPGDFMVGAGRNLIAIDDMPKAVITICYEIIFPGQVAEGSEDAAWIINMTNDAWFGTGSGPLQHLSQAQFRAIEQGLPVVRSANTGISAIIDPYGRIVARIDIGVAGFISHALHNPLHRPLYTRIGEGLVLVLYSLTLIVGFLIARQRA